MCKDIAKRRNKELMWGVEKDGEEMGSETDEAIEISNSQLSILVGLSVYPQSNGKPMKGVG